MPGYMPGSLGCLTVSGLPGSASGTEEYPLTNTQILFLGDSHAELMAKVIRKMNCGIRVYGGAMIYRPSGGVGIFEYEDGCLRFCVPEVHEQFIEWTRAAGAETDNLLEAELPMLFSSGTQPRVAVLFPPRSQRQPLCLPAGVRGNRAQFLLSATPVL